MIYRPVHDVTEARWKDTGEHLSQTVGLANDEYVIQAYCFKDIDQGGKFIFATKEGFIKQTELSDLKPGRSYKSKASKFMKLKTTTDEIILIDYQKQKDSNLQVFCASYNGYGLRYSLEEVPTSGAKAAGVKNMNLRDDFLASVTLVHESDDLALVTQRGSFKRMKVAEVSQTTRAKRGVLILRELKKNPHKVKLTTLLHRDTKLYITTDQNQIIEVDPFEHPSNDRYSNGSFVLDTDSQGEPIWLYSEIKEKAD